MSAAAEAPVFVVGCSRSGTTVLQSILAALPGTASFPEMNFLYRLMPDLQLRRYGATTGWRAVPPLLLRRLPLLLGRTSVDGSPHADRLVRSLGRPDLRGLFPDGSRDVGAWFRAFAAAMDAAAEGRRWVEKSPQNVFCVRHIERHLPRARIVHVVRSGPENVASIIHAADHHEPFRARFNGPDRVKRATAYWNSCLRISARCAGRARHAVVRYEDVVEHGAAALGEVSALVGAEITGDMLAYRTEGIVRPGEAWKESADTAVSARPSRVDTALSAEERDYVHAYVLDADRWVPRRGASA